MSADVIARAEWHRQTFGVPINVAISRAEREFAVDQFWTPWELLGSEFAAEWLDQYVAKTLSTVQ